MAFRRAHVVHREQKHRSLPGRGRLLAAENCLATRESSTGTFTIGRAKSKLNNARGLHNDACINEPLLQGEHL